jgi:hypothetical protein
MRTILAMSPVLLLAAFDSSDSGIFGGRRDLHENPTYLAYVYNGGDVKFHVTPE